MNYRNTLEKIREAARESDGCLQTGLYFLVYFYYYPTEGDRKPIRVSEIRGCPIEHTGGVSVHLTLRNLLSEEQVTPGIYEVQEKASAFLRQILPRTLASWPAEEAKELRRGRRD
jgi:hypothetical protein